MIGLGIPEAAGITGALSAAGLTPSELHRWFGLPRRELPLELSPRAYLELAPRGAGRVLELARADVANAALEDLVGRTPTALPHHQRPHEGS